MFREDNIMTKTIKEWQEYIRTWAESKGFYWTKDDINTVILRIHSEVSEASEAVRDNDMKNLAEEFADIFIRLADACEVMNINLEHEVQKKMEKNEKRQYLHGRNKK